MCFGRRNKDEADATRSRELDKILKADEKRMQKEVKLLLLGMAAPRTSPAPPVLLALPSDQPVQNTRDRDCVSPDHANRLTPCLQEPESLESRPS